MSILPIITLPDPLLRQESTPIERIDPELIRLADNMLETMYDAPGIGLAAIQVGRRDEADNRGHDNSISAMKGLQIIDYCGLSGSQISSKPVCRVGLKSAL